MKNNNNQREAIPVGRFSSDEQELGNSQERQENTFLRMVAQWELKPSTRFKIFDKGKSAFHGQHLEGSAEFGKFLARVRAGEPMTDSNGRKPVLCWEAVDRMTRQAGFKANELVKELVESGFALCFGYESLWVDSETIDDVWVILQIHIDAAHKYSKRLSNRLSSSWKSKRDRAIKGEKVTTKKGKASAACPAWLVPDGDNYKFSPDADLYRQMFRLALEGHGAGTIKKILGTTVDVLGVLRNRAAIGEWQQCQRLNQNDRKEVGTVEGFYPELVDKTTFFQVQQLIDGRRKQVGRKGKFVTNLFQGLFVGMDGLPMHIKGESNNDRHKGRKLLRRKTPGTNRTWDYAPIEKGLLRTLKDVTLLQPVHQGEDFNAILADIDTRIAKTVDLMVSNPSEAIARALQSLEGQRKDVVARQEEAQGQQSAPDLLAEAQTILATLEATETADLLNVRTRVKSLIRGLVKEVRVKIEPKLVAVQVFMVDGRVRMFVLDRAGVYVSVVNECHQPFDYQVA